MAGTTLTPGLVPASVVTRKVEMFEVISTGTEVAVESGTAGAQFGEQSLEDLVFASMSNACSKRKWSRASGRQGHHGEAVLVEWGRSHDEAAAAPVTEAWAIDVWLWVEITADVGPPSCCIGL